MKPRVALLSPLPPTRTGIARYALELAGALDEAFELTLVSNDEAAPTDAFRWQRADEYEAGRFDTAISHIGNNVESEWVYELALRRPGICVLHDASLHHFISAVTLGRGDSAAYVWEMAYSHGAAGGLRARRERAGFANEDASAFPLTGRLLDSSGLVLVHSRHAEAAALAVRPNARIVQVPQLATPPATSRAAARARLGIGESTIVLGMFGLVSPEKRLESVYAALAEADLPDKWILAVVGELGTGWLAPPSTLAESVVTTGFAEHDLFCAWVAASDIAIALRNPTFGETSAAALRCAAAGVPLVVTASGAFQELPPAAVRSIPTDEREVPELSAGLADLARDQRLRQSLGSAGSVWAASALSRAAVRDAYVAAVRRVLGE